MCTLTSDLGDGPDTLLRESDVISLHCPLTPECNKMNRRRFIAFALASSLASASAEEQRKFRVAVIGHTGRGNYGHDLDKVWRLLPETEIVAVADADAKGLAAELKKLKLDRGFADYRAMLAEVKPDIVAICPRCIDQHRDMALAAIECGARGIYIEKPLCRSLAEADEIIAACERRNVKLAVAHRNRYHPALPVVTRMVKEGAIGELQELRGRGKEDERGGVLDLWVLGAHVFNLAHYFAGRPLACTAGLLQDGRPVTRADIQEGAEGVGPVAGNELHARFETERGVPFLFRSVRLAGNKAAGFGLQLVGTKGTIDLRVDMDPFAVLLASGKPVGPAGDDAVAPVKSHELAARDLLAAMREDRAPLCDAKAGRMTIEMISAVLESHRTGGRRVTFPLATRQNPLSLV